ncbi:MAG TPA: hypothetical protein VHE61_20205, partial [Opitutaceae bacterium]|nr:hypothetical protein [Opitutaceae bacterium]
MTNAVITVVLLVLGAGRGSRGANAKPTAGKSDTAFTRAADVPADLARPPAVNAAPGTSAWSAAIKAARVERERALREG